MDWHLNRALTNFRAAVNARWPGRDKTSDGTIGDYAHRQTSSDHNPDPDGSVDAWDMDIDGVDVWACINAALKHESIQYIIYNRRITSRSWGLGVWRYYDGPNPHDKHVHFNTRSSHENSTAPWNLGGWMPTDADFNRLETKIDSIKTIVNVAGYRVDAVVGNKSTYNNQMGDPAAPNRLAAKLDAVEAKVNALAAITAPTVTVDPAQLAAALADPAFVGVVADAVADLLHSRLAD